MVAGVTGSGTFGAARSIWYVPEMAAQADNPLTPYPDVTIVRGHDGPDADDARAFDNSQVLLELTSGGAARTDFRFEPPE